MTPKDRVIVARLAEAHDELAIQTLALTAVVGTVLEQAPPQRERVMQWCKALAGVSGVPAAKLQFRVESLLGRRPAGRPGPTNPRSGRA